MSPPGEGARLGQSYHEERAKVKSQYSLVFEVVIAPQGEQLLGLKCPSLFAFPFLIFK